jgi:glutathione synthase/RimK-type ligase-like ATP-grasp enzyme
MRPKYRLFRPRIRSRHPSHSALRPKLKNLPLFPFKSIIRFGSITTRTSGSILNAEVNMIELNTIESIKNSSNKLLMKSCFDTNEVKTADWWTYISTDLDFGFVLKDGSSDSSLNNLEDLPYPIISKNIYGSRGTGNKKHDTPESLRSWMVGKSLTNYIFEKYHNYVREYRLHVDSEGCFYACRKMLKSDTPQESRWYRNNDHCVWIMESNELFDKPSNWDEIVLHSVNALKAVELDVGAVDLRVQSAKNQDETVRENPKFIVIEINSAPSFGTITEEKYIEQLPKILNRKYNESN